MTYETALFLIDLCKKKFTFTSKYMMNKNDTYQVMFVTHMAQNFKNDVE